MKAQNLMIDSVAAKSVVSFGCHEYWQLDVSETSIYHWLHFMVNAYNQSWE
jgi:hypothetical protein